MKISTYGEKGLLIESVLYSVFYELCDVCCITNAHYSTVPRMSLNESMVYRLKKSRFRNFENRLRNSLKFFKGKNGF